MGEKLRAEEELLREIDHHKACGRKIVFTNGCFDLLHIGHVRYLKEAKRLGEVLVVAINSDRSTTHLKGPSRPINTQQDRAEVLAALACVDYVTIFDEPDPHRIISVLKPDLLVKGGDWTPETTIGREIVEREGGRVVVVPYVEGISTTDLISRIVRTFTSTSRMP